MKLNGLTLVIPDKADPERDAVAKVWEANGGNVFRIGRFWDPPELKPETAKVYGNDTFCLVLAQKLGLELVEPKDEFLAHIPQKFLQRSVRAMSLCDARNETFPQFMKSAAPKVFRAAIYPSVEDLNKECKDLEDSTMVLVSDIVEVESEARCFVLNQQVLDCAIYEGGQPKESALDFANAVVAELQLPSTCVMDIGYFKGLGWGIIEFNASWGAGLNGCDAKKVYLAILGATNEKST